MRSPCIIVAFVVLVALSGTARGDMRGPTTNLTKKAHQHSPQCTCQRRGENVLGLAARAGVGLWQNVLTRGDGNRCRFSPSCSEYGRQAFARHGFFLGGFMAADRILRDHPYNDGAYGTVKVSRFRLLLRDPLDDNDFWLRRRRTIE